MVARIPIEALRSSSDGARLLRALDTVDTPAFLVGGAVRDLLLGRAPRELDVVVEGDVDALAEALGGEVVRHDRFGTATVTADGATFDLARARQESYPAPGALPEVRPATLREDLRRRDVTVNAIALTPSGELIAVDGALDDLDARLLRVLHDESFLDDPTRLWRVARYAARLRFQIERHTAELAHTAVAGGALSTVSGPRIGNEVRLALCERDAHGALGAAHALGLLPSGFDHPGPRASVAGALLPPDGRADLLALATWATAADPAVLRTWLDALAFPAEDRDVVIAAASAPARMPVLPERPSTLARLLRSEPVEAVALGGAATDPSVARLWIEDLRTIALDIDGEDLLAAGIAPGPDLGARLGRALDARLDGEAPDRDSQLARALADAPDLAT